MVAQTWTLLFQNGGSNLNIIVLKWWLRLEQKYGIKFFAYEEIQTILNQ